MLEQGNECMAGKAAEVAVGASGQCHGALLALSACRAPLLPGFSADDPLTSCSSGWPNPKALAVERAAGRRPLRPGARCPPGTAASDMLG